MTIEQADALRKLIENLEVMSRMCVTTQYAKAMGKAAAVLRDYAQVVDPWRPMETAPRDGTPVLLLGASNVDDHVSWLRRLQFVGRYTGDFSDWSFAAPVGMGGIPDAWLAGWKPLPPPLTAALFGREGDGNG